MPTKRLALLLAAVVAAAVPMTAGAAAPKPLLTDPAGDARVLGGGFDIVSGNFATTGTTKKVGKKTVYTPKYLLTSLTLAAPPSTTPGMVITFFADSSACDGGTFEWTYRPGNKLFGDGDVFITGCGAPLATDGPSEIVGTIITVSGNTITWKLALADMGRDLPVGSTFSNFRAYADVNDPSSFYGTNIGNESGTGLGIDTSIDSAKTDSTTYKLK